MISREEYLKALEIIDLYHRQSTQKVVKGIKDLTISEFLKRYREQIPARVFNVLSQIEYYRKENHVYSYTDFSDCDCIGNITKRHFFLMRNAGKKTYEEFIQLIEK